MEIHLKKKISNVIFLFFNIMGIPVVLLKCYVLGDGNNSSPYTTCCATHITCASCGYREHWIGLDPIHSPTPYISPFQSLNNERQQAGTLLKIHSLSLHATAQFSSPFPPSLSFFSIFNLFSFYVAPSLLPGLLKRREEDVAKNTEYEEANNPVDRVYADDDHVHVKAPASRVIRKVHGVQTVATSVGEVTSSNGAGLPLKAWFGQQTLSLTLHTKSIQSTIAWILWSCHQ